MSEAASGKLRLDKWLWHARFFKARTLASRHVSDGSVRLNGDRITKPAQLVGAGDVLTFAQSRNIRVVQVVAMGTRRGPATEAQALYLDFTPEETAAPQHERVGARPTKKDRRAVDAFRSGDTLDRG